MPNLFFAGQTDYIEKLNTLATTESVTNGSLAADFLSLVVAGLAAFGGGLQVDAQGSAPATPDSGFTIFSDASDIPGWKGANGYIVKLDATANTADRTYTLPNASGTFALLGSAQTFTAAQTVSINSANAALTLTQAGAGAALSTNGQIVSTLGSGTAPFSVVSTTQVNNLNAQYLGGATFAAPGTIGGGTPGAATFTTLTAGVTRVSAADASSPMFGVSGTTRGVRINASSYGTSIEGVDNTLVGSFQPLNVMGTTLGLYSTGTGNVQIGTNSGSSIGLVVSHIASAVNYPQVAGSATTNSVRFDFTGTDASVGTFFVMKGSGTFNVCTSASSGNRQFQFAHTASAVNYGVATGGATGDGVKFQAAGSDTNISTYFYNKGAGGWEFTNTSQVRYFSIGSNGLTTPVNYIQITPNSTGNSPLFTAIGSDTNVGTRYRTQGTGSHLFETGSSANYALVLAHVASVANRYTIQGGPTTLPPFLYADGNDTNVSAGYSLKGAGNHVFYTGTTTVVQAFITHTAAAVNALILTGGAAGNPVTISTFGSDTNRSITLTAAGAGTVNVSNPLGLKRYTVATLPAATTDRLIIVSDESGGLVPAFSDGTNWRRVTDRAIVS